MKWIDLTFQVTEGMWTEALENERMAALGHMGTHFDVMNKQFPLENVRRRGRLLDVRTVRTRDITVHDLAGGEIDADDSVIFYTGYLSEVGYGTKAYFAAHPEQSQELIDYLIGKRVSLIGLDAAGVRRGAEHTPTDQYCADHGVFIIENLDHLDVLSPEVGVRPFVVYTFPMSIQGMTGLPSRVVAEV